MISLKLIIEDSEIIKKINDIRVVVNKCVLILMLQYVFAYEKKNGYFFPQLLGVGS